MAVALFLCVGEKRKQCANLALMRLPSIGHHGKKVTDSSQSTNWESFLEVQHEVQHEVQREGQSGG